MTSPSDDEKWFVVKGRRWRRTDPAIDDDVVARLQSHLGRGRAGVRAASQRGDSEGVRRARRRVGLAKHGLGERGPYWWDDAEKIRQARAQDALTALEELDPDEGSGEP